MLSRKFEAVQMKKHFFSMALASVSCVPALAADLQSELLHLRDNHPMLRATTFAVTASDKRYTAAQAGWLPKIDLAAERGPEKSRPRLTPTASPAQRLRTPT